MRSHRKVSSPVYGSPRERPSILVINNSGRTNARFTPKLISWVRTWGYNVIEVSNTDELDRVDFRDFTHAILSGGPARLGDQMCVDPCTMNRLALNQGVINNFHGPVLGVCFGMQVMAINYGGHLSTLPKFCRGKKEVRSTRAGEIWINSERYTYANNEVVDIIPRGFTALAMQGRNLAAMADFQRQRYAVQFHPEDGRPEIIQRFLHNRI